MSSRFVHLHLHSEFSLADSTIRIPQLVARCAALNQPALAVTDRNSLAGVVRAHLAAKTAGLKLLIGAELHFCDSPPVAVWMLRGEEAPLKNAREFALEWVGYAATWCDMLWRWSVHTISDLRTSGVF